MTVITHRANSTGGSIPSAGAVAVAELCINTGDGKIYAKMANSTVIQLAVRPQGDTMSGDLVVGNSTVNATINSTSVKVMNSTSNSTFAIPSAADWAGNKFLHANGTWATPVAAASPAGSNTHVQFNDSGDLGGEANLTWDKATMTLYAANNVKTGNSTVNSTMNATSMTVANSTSSTSQLVGTIVVGNSTVNAVVNSTAFKVANSTSNTTIPIPTTAQWSGSYFLHANGTWAVAGGGATTADSAPGSPADGALWWNSADGNMYVYYDDGTSSQWVPSTTARSTGQVSAFAFVIDGGGTVITPGVKGYIEVPFPCNITAARMLADQSGSIVVDIWKDTYANYPPTDADSITASAPPTISSATKSQDTTLSGWTVSLAAGDVLGFNVDSVTSIMRVTLSLTAVKT